MPPLAYYLSESDPDIVIFRRQDNSFVSVFSALGATREGILEAAKEDYRALVGAHTSWREKATEENPSERNV